MAFPNSPFSIREYALEMRGKNIEKSWPFSGSEDVAKALLPPISVTKFRWWQHELEVLSSNHCETEKESEEEIMVEKICPVCGVFVTATVNAMNVHMDSCLAQTTKQKTKNRMVGGGFLKVKSRTPKKRSIAEIFAVAPPVETMKNKTTSLASNIVSAMKKTIKANKTKIKYKNKNKNKDFGGEQLCKKGKRNVKDILVGSKKPCFKRLSRQKKQKIVAKAQQRPVPTIRSILKHGVKLVSETNPSSINNHRCQRVSFSDKDDVLGPSGRAISDIFQQNGVNPFQPSDGSTNSSVEVGVNKDVVGFSTRHEVDSHNTKGKIQLPNNIHDQVNAQKSTRPHPCWDDNANHSTEKLISENRVFPHENNMHLFDAPQNPTSVHSAIPSLLAAQEERQYGHVRTQCGLSFPRPHSFYGNSTNHLINPINEVAALGSMTSTVPSFALSENALGRYLNLDDSSAIDSTTQCCFPNWEQSEVAYEEKGVNDGLFCLPLNSKGELIPINSGLVNGFDQMNEGSNNMACSSRVPVCGLVLPRTTRDYFIDNDKFLVDPKLTGNQLTLFPLCSNMQENRHRYLSAGLDTTELGTSETADIRLLNSERVSESGRFIHSNLMEHQYNGCYSYPNTSSMLANPAQQTMRLMGKDVAVGGNGKEVQEPEVINFWKNSAIIKNSLTNPFHIQENPMRKRNFVQDNRVFYPAGFHGNQRNLFPNAPQVRYHNLSPSAPQVRYPHLRVDRKNSTMYQRSNSVMNLNERFNNIHAFSHSPTEAFISGPETLRFGSQPNIYENSFEFGFNQNNLHPAKLGNFNFPFLQPDDENRVQLPWFHSCNSLPPWMLHGHQREEAPPSSCKLADINGYRYSSISSGHHQHEDAYPCSTMASHLQMKNIPASTSFFQPIPVASRVHPPSIRMSSEDRLKLNTLSAKDYDLSSKKRRAAELDNLRTHQKIPSFEMNNAGGVPLSTRGKFIDDAQYIRGSTVAGNISNVTQYDLSTIEPCRDECIARSGPIKLTAGAKHILKPSESMNVDTTNPIYSTIPSAGLVHSVSFAESQKKSTRVYSF